MIYNYFPVRVRKFVKIAMEKYEYIEEIRVRSGQSVIFSNLSGKWFLDDSGRLTKSEKSGIKLHKDDLKEMFKYFTQNSVYAMQQDIKNGFITLADGTRVGLCGRCVIKNGNIENISNISSFNIRLSRQVQGWGNDLFERIQPCSKNILIVAPPGMGKTTLLRNLIKFVSDQGRNVSVLDEKCEISPIADGKFIYDLGLNTDVLSDTPKNIGINMMIRTMNPEIVATDEILTKEDFDTIKICSLSGIKVFATFHGKSEKDYLVKAKAFGVNFRFDICIVISENENFSRIIDCKLQEEL